MIITEQAAQVLREIDAALALAEKAHGDVPPDYTYCPGLADYYEAATDNRGWPLSLRCLKTAIEGLLERANLDGYCVDGNAKDDLTALCNQWSAAK